MIRSRVGADLAAALRPQYPGIIIKDIGDAALAAAESMDPALRHSETAHWDWRQITLQFRANLTCMRIAIWNNTVVNGEQRNALHALAVGRTSSTGKAVSVEALESFPFGNHPFCGDVLSIVTRFAGTYGALMGAEKLSLINPAAGLVDYYSRAGFAIDTLQSKRCMTLKIGKE